MISGEMVRTVTSNGSSTEPGVSDSSQRAPGWSAAYTDGFILRGAILLGSISMTSAVTTDGALVDSSFQHASFEWKGASEPRVRTDLGRRLWALRQKIVASGERLLDWDGIRREVAERRGGVERDSE